MSCLNPEIEVPGRISSFSLSDSRASGKTENCNFRITIYDEQTIRIQVTRNKEYSPNP
jgi:alpha-glucosidase